MGTARVESDTRPLFRTWRDENSLGSQDLSDQCSLQEKSSQGAEEEVMIHLWTVANAFIPKPKGARLERGRKHPDPQTPPAV